MTGLLGGLIGAALPLLRQQAESMMIDTCIIRRPGSPVVDPATNRLVPGGEVVYEGPCRLRSNAVQTEGRDVEQQLLVVHASTLSLPYATSSGVRVDDVAEIPAHGVTVRIAGPFAQTHATARRFPVEEVR